LLIYREQTKKKNLPVLRKTDPSHILGQGLAMTVDESFKEFYNPGKFKISNREGESINFNEFTIKKLNSIHDVSRIGTFGQLKLSN